MNLQFITSVSKSYWESVGKYCIGTWDLPGEIVIYIDQPEGDVEWFNDIPHKKKLVYVPPLDVADYLDVKTKVRKFWGKSCAQIHAIRNRPLDTRVIWLDADMEQLKPVSANMFDFSFKPPVAMMKSNTWSEDCYESGLVIFNQQHEKLTLFANQYEKFWKNEEDLLGLFRPYDAMVLGAMAEKRGFLNLCNQDCDNKDALEYTDYKGYFKHWINKENKAKLKEQISEMTNEDR
jgi:hypothetical protein